MAHDKFYGVCENKCLVEINAEKVGAAAANHTHTAEEVGAAAAEHTHTAEEVGAASVDHTHTAAEVGAAAENHTHEASAITYGDGSNVGEQITNISSSITTIEETVSGLSGVGKSLEGQTVSPTSDTTATAGTGAEIFNDYRDRTFDDSGKVTAGNVASGNDSHAEGISTTASGSGSHAEGNRTTASGKVSHAEGQTTTADGDYSHAGGYSTIADNYQIVHGKYNKSSAGATSDSDTSGDVFILGNGTSTSAKSNAFRVTFAGKAYGLANFSGSGAGVAELYEWQDGNPGNEDRRGLFVTLDGEKIKIASPDDEYILGAIDPCPYVVGDVQSEIWKDMYLKDVFGEKIVETVEVEETTDEETGEVIPAHTEKRWVLNPEYDPTKEYISRDERNEFVAITSKGKVVLIDDGTCQVNGYCTVGQGGKATASDTNYKVRVLKRIDETHIQVYIDGVFLTTN